ncbi:hypothetical protein BSKO_04422 [Bryopsis sp. KO-2023]|nr:hypothetical protein BSKO_04422 [Bryopsis sp. KO-2023]
MARYMHAKTHFFEYDEDAILVPANDAEAAFTSTKVVFTIGPQCQDVETLTKILEAGATAARIDLTWGPMEFHERSLQNLQIAVKNTRRLCAVMLDTIGREIFVKRPHKLSENGWPYHDNPIRIKETQRVTLTARDVAATETVWPLNYSKVHEMAEVGDLIYVSRYLVTGADAASLYFKVVEINGEDVICEAQSTAELDGLLTVYHMERNPYGQIDNTQNELPLLTDLDKESLKKLSNDFEVDFVCLSHTRSTDDLLSARSYLNSIGLQSTKMVAKVETKYGLGRFKGILNHADAIIISRGNLGLDVPVEKMALIQKHIISACNLVGKPVLVTRVVDTMATTPRPTRAEATDVANAILDGADGFLLGAETLRGLYPVDTVNMVLHISAVAERFFDDTLHFDYLMQEAVNSQNGSIAKTTSAASMAGSSYADLTQAIKTMTTFTTDNDQPEHKREEVYTGSPYLSKLESIASSAVKAAGKINASLLVVYTHSGQTAHLVAKYRPKMPILTLVVPKLVTDSLSWRLEGRGTARQCLITRGLLPMLAAPRSSIDSVLEEAVMAAAGMGIVKQDDNVVCVQRIHDDFCLKIVSVNDLVKEFNRAAEVLPGADGSKKILQSVAE